jgi:hypothetical protein
MGAHRHGERQTLKCTPYMRRAGVIPKAKSEQWG